MADALQAPFPYFGGKASVAADVWRALGEPKHYIEPFFGSGAVLLARPGWRPDVHVETVNDADGYVANVWRALQFAPDEVARWCDWPVSHLDLIARKAELLRHREALYAGLAADPQWYDPLMAGYWIWAVSCWIGHGLTRPGQIPHLADAGMGVHRAGQIPHLADAGKGVHRAGQIPHLADAGKGVHRAGKRPQLSREMGINQMCMREPTTGGDVRDPYNTNLYTWFRALSERLRYVRVVCGDWTRVCGGDWQDNLGTVGIFFDPPYGAAAERDPDLYDQESLDVAAAVADWALARGDRPSYRIVLAGYYEEHARLLAHGWRVRRWKAKGGYGNIGKGETAGEANRKREALFFSPHCVEDRGLFDGL